MLQRSMMQVAHGDQRNEGIDVLVHYKYFIDPTVLVYDLRAVAPTASPIDVTRVLLQFAEQQKDQQFKTVELSYRGSEKFLLQGEFFQKMGQEYGSQNAAYTLRTLPENVYKTDGSLAFGQWTGGVFAVLTKQMEDFGNLHRAWYIDDIAASAAGGGLHAQ